MKNDAAGPATVTTLAPPLLVGLLTVAGGVTVLLGWAFDVPVLTSVLPSCVAMKANTAVAFFFAGLSLALWSCAPSFAPARPLALAFAGATSLIGLLTLGQYLFGLDLGIDQLLFREPAGAVGTLSPGRMAPLTAGTFVLLGAALLLAADRRALGATQGLALLTSLSGMLPLLGYVYGTSESSGFGHYAQMAILTAILFVVASVGVLALHRSEGVLAVVDGEGPGRWLTRRMLPFVLGVPPVLGWLRMQGERAGWFDAPLGTALMMLCMMVLLTGMISWAARALNGVDAIRVRAGQAVLAERLQAAHALVQSEMRYRRLFEATLKEMQVGPRTFGISVERDVTGRKAAEVTSRQQQKLEAIGTLASGVAHEINNPLNVNMNYSQLLLDDPTDPDKVKDYAANVLIESERMVVIVRNLLNFARQESEAHSPARVVDIVDKTLSLLGAILRKNQIAVHCEIPEGLPAVRCRSQQIQQVLMNLLTNARDALNVRYPKTSEDKVIRIVASALEEDGQGWVRLTVEDHGGGIPPGIADRVFDPFFTTKSRDQGTGLGLSISHGIVQEHQGRLTFETEPGRGTRFHLDLRAAGGRAVPSPPGAHPLPTPDDGRQTLPRGE